MSSPLEKYLLAHSTPFGDDLQKIEAATHMHTNYPRMMCGPVQGRLLTMLTRIGGVRRALEIGTFTGYSAACIASGLPEDGLLDTLEIDDELEDMIRKGWRDAGLENRIRLHTGPALGTLTRLPGPYDLAYIDADKREYIDYYEAVLPKLRPGGIIIADDVLLGGKPYDENCSDAKTQALRAFNEHVKNDPRVEVVILPLRDGISIIRKF